MGSFCSKASRPIKQVMEKTSSTPQIRQPQVQSKLDTSSKSPAPTNKQPSSLSNQPRRGGGVLGEIAKQATGVAIGTAAGKKLSDMMFDNKKNESPTETDNSNNDVDNQMKNEELTEDGSDEQGDQGDEENDDDSD